MLERIDAVSAVSGGSSALAWYFTQHWYGLEAPRKPSREDVDQRLFADELQPQQYLRNHFTTFSKVEYGLGAAANGLLAPVNLFLNGLFGWHANTSPMRAWYEARLRTTFQADPTDPEGRTDTDLHMTQLTRLVETRQLPWPIIGATALIEHDLQHLGARLGNVVFEFTPYAFGSDAFGRHRYESDAGRKFTLSRAVSISSAAFDGATLVTGPSQAMFWSLLNFDTGMYVHNPALNRLTRRAHRLLPWPTYYFDFRNPHAENLGAYSLVRRGCARIIVVDAEHDPTYIFDAYRRLQHGLRTEMDATLRVGAIENILANPLGRSKNQLLVDSERWHTVANTPVVEGWIAQLPLKLDDSASQLSRTSIPVLYVK
ncbi:MAG: hypothetical protein DMD91_20960, partial [Candidatus Rokuibacteriota bacterium]